MAIKALLDLLLVTVLKVHCAITQILAYTSRPSRSSSNISHYIGYGKGITVVLCHTFSLFEPAGATIRKTHAHRNKSETAQGVTGRERSHESAFKFV